MVSVSQTVSALTVTHNELSQLATGLEVRMNKHGVRFIASILTGLMLSFTSPSLADDSAGVDPKSTSTE